jgi:4-methyl-5(b-hydroxyethyl)-thiazole monophosphate biosynthesis
MQVRREGDMGEKRILVPIADGTEEIEAVSIIDVLRRAGAEVTVAAVGKGSDGETHRGTAGPVITASRGVKIVADRTIRECVNESFDLVVLPGGTEGAEKLRDSEDLRKILLRQRDEDRPYAAICAAPAVVLEHHGLLQGHRATCHPNFADRLSTPEGSGARVVVDGNVVTSRGPGTAIEFALKLVEILFGSEVSEQVAHPMIVR